MGLGGTCNSSFYSIRGTGQHTDTSCRAKYFICIYFTLVEDAFTLTSTPVKLLSKTSYSNPCHIAIRCFNHRLSIYSSAIHGVEPVETALESNPKKQHRYSQYNGGKEMPQVSRWNISAPHTRHGLNQLWVTHGIRSQDKKLYHPYPSRS